MLKRLVLILLVLFVFKTEAQSSVLKIADSLLQTGDYKTALEKLTVQKKPSFAVLKKTASIYQKIGSYAKAIQFYDKAYAIKASDKVKEETGRCYQALGNTEKAITLYKEVLKENPKNLLLKYQLAKLYLNSRRVTASEQLFNELIVEDASNPNYYYQLGVVYNKQKKDASKPFLKAYHLDTTDVKTIYGLAKFFKQVKVPDSSAIFTNKGLRLVPNNLNFLQLKVQQEYLKKEYDTTLVYLKKMEKLKFSTPFTLKLFGKSYFRLGDYENALTYFRKGRNKNRLDSDFLYQIGLCQYKLKEFKRAQMSFLMAIYAEKVDLSEYYFQLSQTFLALKDSQKAIKSLEDGLKNSSSNENLMYHLAIVSDSYYKDEKLVLKRYEKYIDRHENKNKERTTFATERIKEIKKALFIKGKKSE